MISLTCSVGENRKGFLIMVKFKGNAQGFHGPVTVTVDLIDGKLVSVTSEHDKMAYIGNLGIQRLLSEINQTHSLEVDAVSGATFSTQAFLKAARKAVAVGEGKLSPAEGLDLQLEWGVEEQITTDTISSASITTHDEVNTSVAKPAVFMANDKELFDEVFDVVIAGSGGAGLSAAVEAARGGLKTLVCEKAGIPGGTTNASGGVIQAAGTKYQKEFTKFKNDTPKKHAQLWVAAGEGSANEDLVWDLALGAPANIDWLVELGLEFDTVYGHAKIPYIADDLHADRIHQYQFGGASGTGTLMIEALLSDFQKNAGVIYYDCPVIALIQDEETHEIIGALVEKAGQEVKIKAECGVVLATASVDHNPALAKEFNAQQYHDISNATLLSTPFDTGDGIMMGMSVGGAISGMGGTIDFCGRTGNATNNTIPTIPLFHVNGIGKRFVREDATYAYQYRAIFQETKKHASPTYMVFGETSIVEPGSAWTAETLANDIDSGLVYKADTIEDLAPKIKVPANNLKETLDQWNKYAVNAQDPEFGREQGLKPIVGPFYAMLNKATNLGSLGGMSINTDSQVLDNFGEPIKGLYAAGLNAGGWVTGYYPGSGTAIAGIIHQGRKAGKHLAANK